jgi:hypothetical protein
MKKNFKTTARIYIYENDKKMILLYIIIIKCNKILCKYVKEDTGAKQPFPFSHFNNQKKMFISNMIIYHINILKHKLKDVNKVHIIGK